MGAKTKPKYRKKNPNEIQGGSYGSDDDALEQFFRDY